MVSVRTSHDFFDSLIDFDSFFDATRYSCRMCVCVCWVFAMFQSMYWLVFKIKSTLGLQIFMKCSKTRLNLITSKPNYSLQVASSTGDMSQHCLDGWMNVSSAPLEKFMMEVLHGCSLQKVLYYVVKHNFLELQMTNHFRFVTWSKIMIKCRIIK